MKQTLKLTLSASIVSLFAALPTAAIADMTDGATCRSGYTGKLNAGKFTCEKTVVKSVEFTCNPESPLKNYVVRVNNQRDLCAADGLNIPSSGTLEGYDQAGARIPGQPTLIRLPANVALPANFANRAGIKEIPGGFRTIPITDADFTFVGTVEGMNKGRAASVAAAEEVIHRKGPNGALYKMDTKVVSHRVVNDGGPGSKDALEVTYTEFTAPIVAAN
jgi:hypothetical protein